MGPDKRPQIPDQCTIYRGSGQVMTVQLRSLIDSGSPLADLRLRRDDVIYVPDPRERFVSVLGEVNHPGAVRAVVEFHPAQGAGRCRRSH